MSESLLRIERNEGVTVVGFAERTELDSLSSDQVGRELFALVEEEEPPNVVVDLANVDFLSSQAIGVLLTLRLKAARTGAEVVLAAVPSKFDEIFKLTNFEQLYQVFPTVADAAARFNVET